MKQFFTLLLLLFSISSSFAGIIYVKPDGNGNGTSWSQAYGSLSEALQNAQTGDEIWVAQGVYFPSATGNTGESFNFKNGVKMYGGFSGSETSVSGRADTSGTTTILSGEIGNNMRSETILKINNAASSLNLIDGFTLKGGLKAPTVSGHGGVGLQILNSAITLKNVTVRENEMEVTNLFSNDTAHVGGVGIYSLNSTLVMEAVNIVDNHLLLTHTVQGSSTQGGVGIYAKGGTLSFTRGSLERNNANYSGYFVFGGGALLQSVNNVYIANVLINENELNSFITQPQGCGLYISSCPDVKILNSIFHKNYANHTQTNGNVVNVAGNALTVRTSTAVITNVTFGKNAASSTNISIKDDYGTNFTFNNCVFTERFAFTSSTTCVFNHCISGSSVAYSDILMSGNHTINGFVTAVMDFINPEKGNYIPKYCSPYLNMGNNSYNALAADFLGNPRIFGAGIDYGAVEVQQPNTVNRLYVDAASTNQWADGTGWDNAFSDLQDALKCKCAVNGPTLFPEEIWVAQGTYTPGTTAQDWFVLNSGQKLYGGFENGATSLEDRNIEFSTMQTILSGEYEAGSKAVHVVYSENNSIDTEINGFIIEKGKADDIAGFGILYMSGGGIVVANGKTTLKNLWVRDNISGNPGVYVPGQSFSTGYGGGIMVYKSTVEDTPDTGVNMENVRVSNNIGYGAGICFDGSASNAFTSTLRNIEVYDNVSTPFYNNSTGNGAGGGIRVDGMFHINIEDFYIANNQANWLGAGLVVNSNSGTINMKRGVFEGNGTLASVSGGAIYSSSVPPSTINIESVVFAGNNSKDGTIAAASAIFNITNCTFSGNAAQQQSNLFEITGGSVNLRNSIIDSPLNGINDVFIGNGSASAQNCLFVNTVPSGITDLGNLLPQTNPMFADAQNGNFQLLEGSPAIDTGANDFVLLSPDLDAAGNPRISINTVDLGAFEFQQSLSTHSVDDAAVLSLYPNPGMHYFNLKSDKLKRDGTVTVYDLQGKVMHQEALNGEQLKSGLTVQTSEWAAGIYLVKYSNDTNTETIKYIKL